MHTLVEKPFSCKTLCCKSTIPLWTAALVEVESDAETGCGQLGL